MMTAQGTKQRSDLRLTPDVVQRIRQLKMQGCTVQQLAARFGVAKGTISHVVNRRGHWSEQ